MYSVKQLSEKSDIIITMIGTPDDVEAVYFGTDGLIENVKPNTMLIDMTTSKPSLAKNIYDIAKLKDIKVLDAPVSGGDVGANNGKLDRKSTRLNSSHVSISYAVFCLKKK